MKPAVDPRSWLFWSGLPVIAAQGLWLRKRAYRAAEAPGPRQGIAHPEIQAGADRPALKLRALGDSIIAGVALDSSAEALPAQLAAALAGRTGRAVNWQALGRNGANAGQALQAARETLALSHDTDLVLISTGVNDVTGLRRRQSFAHDLTELIVWLTHQAPTVRILLCATPPLDAFPLLPSPLRDLLSLRARQFDAIVAAVAASSSACLHAPMPFKPQPHGFAKDGFHPNAASVAQWADWLAEQVLIRWPDLVAAGSDTSTELSST